MPALLNSSQLERRTAVHPASQDSCVGSAAAPGTVGLWLMRATAACCAQIHMTLPDKSAIPPWALLSLASWATHNPSADILLYNDTDIALYVCLGLRCCRPGVHHWGAVPAALPGLGSDTPAS